MQHDIVHRIYELITNLPLACHKLILNPPGY